MEGFSPRKERNAEEKLQSLNYETILTTNGATVVEPGVSTIPDAIDSSLLEELTPSLQRKLHLATLSAEEYLRGPIFLDQFGNDAGQDPWLGRRRWQGELKEKYGEEFDAYYQTNRLKAGRITGPITAFDRLKEKLPENEQRSLRLQELEVLLTRILAPFEPVSEIGNKYRLEMPLPERLELVQQLSASCREFLNFVSKGQKDEFQMVA